MRRKKRRKIIAQLKEIFPVFSLFEKSFEEITKEEAQTAAETLEEFEFFRKLDEDLEAKKKSEQ